MTPSSRVIDTVLKRALCMRKCFCRTPEIHPFADVIPPFGTPLTFPTGQARLKSYLVPNLKVGHCGAHSDNYACGFMAQRHRFLYNDVAIAVMPVVVEVGTTEACCAD